MSNPGQLVLTVAGTVIGAAVGNPQLGFALGSFAGQLAFPTKIPAAIGPTIADPTQPLSTVGRPLQLTYGTGEIQGINIWCGPAAEIKNTVKQGGKGAPTQKQITYTYTRSYAVVFGSRPKAGCLAIKRNGKWEYDVRPQRSGEGDEDFMARIAASVGFLDRIEIYLGTESQMPSPTIEAVKGAGNVTAYRGRPYIVFVDDDVTATQKMPADIVAVWADSVDSSGEDARDIQRLASWSERDQHEWLMPDGTTWTTSLDTAFEAHLDATYPADPAGVRFYSGIHGSGPYGGLPYGGVTAANLWALLRRPELSVGDGGQQVFTTWASAAEVMDDEAALTIAYFSPTVGSTWVDSYKVAASSCGGAGPPLDVLYSLSGGASIRSKVANSVTAPIAGWRALADFCLGSPTQYIYGYPLLEIAVRRRYACAQLEEDCIPLPESPNFCVIDGPAGPEIHGEYTAITPVKQLATERYESSPLGPGGRPYKIAAPSAGPWYSSGETEYSDEATWTAAYEAELASGSGAVEPGWFYGVDYPVTARVGLHSGASISGCYLAEVLRGVPVTIASVISDIAARSGLQPADIDVQVTGDVEFLSVTQQATGRQMLETLQVPYLFDVIDDAQLHFLPRGGAVARSYEVAEVGAHYAGESAPEPRVGIELTQPPELPAAVVIRYLDVDTGAMAEQRYGAQSPEQEQLVTYDLSVALSADRAAQLAQILYTSAHVASERYSVQLGPREIDRLPGDIIEVPVAGETTRARITDLNGGLPGVIVANMERDEASGWTSTSVGQPSPPLVTTATLKGPTGLLLLDLPVIVAETDDNAGYRAAVRGILSTWPGAQVQRSLDDGGTWSAQYDTALEATQGTVGEPPADAEPWTWDRTNTLTVTLTDGVLESSTEALVLAGANLFAYQVRDSDGATLGWELCQFVTASQDSDGVWTISQLLWGRRGSEWAVGQHQDGDRFVLIGDGVTRLSLDAAMVGFPVDHRAVTLGTSADATVVVDFTPQGVALLPLAPTYIRTEIDADGRLRVAWVPRSRTFNQVWRDGLPIPSGEPADNFDFEIRSGTGLLVKSGSTSEYWTYFDAYIELGTIPVSLRTAESNDGYVIGMYTQYPAVPSFRVLDGTSLEYINGCTIDIDVQYVTGFVRVVDDWFVTCIGTGSGGDGVFKASQATILASNPAGIVADSMSTGSARGLCYDGTYLWVCDAGAPKQIRCMDTDLVEIDTISTSGILAGGAPSGIDTDGTNLFVMLRGGTDTESRVAKIRISDSAVLWSTTVPAFGAEVVLVGGAVFAWCTYDSLIALDLSTGNVLETWPVWSESNQEGPHDLFNYGVPGFVIRSVDSRLQVRYRRGDRYGVVAIDPTTLEIDQEWFWEDEYYVGTFGDRLLVGDRILTPGTDGTNEVTVWQISDLVGRGYPGVAIV